MPRDGREDRDPLVSLSEEEFAQFEGITPEEIEEALRVGFEQRRAVEAAQGSIILPGIMFRG